MKRKAIAKILISFFIILLSGCSKTEKTEMTSETIKQDSTVSEVIDEETVISHIAIEPIQFTDGNNIDYLLFDIKNNYNEALYLSIKVLFYDTNDKVIHTEDCGGFYGI